MFNHAVHAAREDAANSRQAQTIKLDEFGSPVNTGPHGRPFHYRAVQAAQMSQRYKVYQGAMIFLDSIIGDDADTATRKAYSYAKSKFLSRMHAKEMIDKLVSASLRGSKAALIGYAAACVYLNPYGEVDFDWYVNRPEVVVDFQPFSTTPGGAFGGHVNRPEELVDPKGANERKLVRVANGWKAKSKSQAGRVYIAALDGSTCSCPGFKRWRKCWHTTTVKTCMAQE